MASNDFDDLNRRVELALGDDLSVFDHDGDYILAVGKLMALMPVMEGNDGK